MFRKPRVNQPPSTVLGHSPSSSSTSSPPVDLTSSPPSAKKQKTTHPAPTITLPTPSRPRAPRQTQLTPFVSTPTTSKKTTPIKSTGKKKAKNTSILKFFKPLTKEEAANGRRRKEDGYSDSLFIAHGGYGLDVSDPEDGDDNDDADEDVRIALWGRPGVEVEDAAEPPSNDAMEELELVGEIVQTDEIIADYAPGTADTVETSTPSTPPKPKLEAPKFNPSTLKLNISASMLFGKVPPTPSVTEEDSTVSTSDSITRDDPKTELAKCGNGKDSLKRGLLWRRDAMGEGEALDEIEDPTQTQRNKKRPFFQPELKDEIQSTFEQMNVNPEDGAKDGDQDLSSCNDDVEDSGDDEIGFEEREAYFGFDPAARAIEGGFEDWGGDMEIVMKPPDCDDIEATPTEDVAAPLCPVCETKLVGLSEADANNHVNHCLDGNPIPLPKLEPNVTAITFTKPPTSRTSNPHSALQMSGKSQGHSAFAKLMSTNTEAHAWAAAAKAEVDSKGVKAAERTCPFYKILFNGPISVDAFRYGAVPSCNAYFLSHFHSDHYVGLASKWDHGPIYCSRVTANLVRTRLKVDPIWVHELPWEEWFEVPNTNGVRVQGLDANHCPGSMLFLFEKEVKGKRTRILHCGDFRADPKHLSHPLLKPGKDRKQKLDTVYLDTTYLDPKYAFPSQKSVIDACAEMCVALHQEKPLGIKKEHGRLGGFMTKSPEFKKEPGVGTSKGRLLVVVGTYSIGKERICTGLPPSPIPFSRR